jgi:hypothetical protein
VTKARGTNIRLLGAALLAIVALVSIGLAAESGGVGAGETAVVVWAVVGALAFHALGPALNEIRRLITERDKSGGPWTWRGRVDKATVDVIGAWSLPADRSADVRYEEYVDRDADAELRALVRSHRFVIVRGLSLAGKSRALYEAAKKEFPSATLIVPDPDANRCLAEIDLLLPRGEVVIWLDNLRNYLQTGGVGVSSGLTVAQVERWIAGRRKVHILATIRTDEWKGFTEATFPRRKLASGSGRSIAQIAGRTAWEILQKGHRFDLPGPASKAECDRAAKAFPETITEGRSFGESLVRLPQMLESLKDASVQEAAVIWAAADWQRLGAGQAVGLDSLRAVWRAWMKHQSASADDTAFDAALEFATRPLSDSALSFVFESEQDRYEARDYFVAMREDPDSGVPIAAIPVAVWTATIGCADPRGLVRIGVRAELAGMSSLSVSAWERALAASVHDDARARAAFNLELHYARADDLPLAIATGERLWATFGEVNEPDVRQTVADGLHNLALHYARADDLPLAIATGERLWATFGEVNEPDVRQAVADGLHNLALDYASADDLPLAIATGEKLWATFGEVNGPDVRQTVAGGLENLALAYGSSNDLHSAIRICQLLLDRFGEAPQPEIQEIVDRMSAKLTSLTLEQAHPENGG